MYHTFGCLPWRLMFCPFLLLALAVRPVMPVQFRELSGSRVPAGVLAETGYPEPLINYVWTKYGLRAPHNLVATLEVQPPYCHYYKVGPANIIAALLYVGLWYIHTYPSTSAMMQRPFKYIGRVSKRKFYEMVVPVLRAFSDAMDEIYYNDRLHPMNHGLGIFANFVTCFVDTAPIYVLEPTNKALRDMLAQPKYGGCVYKFQIAVNFLGWICYYSGPHHGVVPDNVIYHRTYHQHPLRSWEYWCGDGIYNSCYGVITRFILQARGVFTRFQVFMNRWINRYRQRVEHTMHSIKAHHAMWSGVKFRGSFPMLSLCLKLTVHMTNANIKHAWEPQAFHKYQGYYAAWPAVRCHCHIIPMIHIDNFSV